MSFNGAILRIDPDSGEALPDNPLYGGLFPEDDRIIAYGLRNPFRFFVQPATNEIWIGDVGWHEWEEINHIASPTDSVVENFGWPCYEGDGRQPEYETVDLALCEALYKSPSAVTDPFFAYEHGDPPGSELCRTGPNAAISGITLYPGGEYPSLYDGALFFADFSQSCIWAMFADAAGRPDPSNLSTLVAQAGAPVHLEIGPDGDLFYVDFLEGAIRRIIVDPDAIFSDGFESGDSAAWSATVRSPP